MDPASLVDTPAPTFYVGHHQTNRPLPVTAKILNQAQDLGVRFQFLPHGRLILRILCSMICSPPRLQLLTSTPASLLSSPRTYHSYSLEHTAQLLPNLLRRVIRFRQ